ncbi:MAG: hypothetical protein FWB83_11000, partial [Treponema sp.]|nr:hypothetical protein [Treponema sp.]
SLLQEISKDEREKAINRSRRMYETDRDSDLGTAEARGKIMGRAEGRAEILGLLEKGYSLEEIKKMI